MPGVTTGDIHGKLGVRAGSTGWVACRMCEVPAANRLGEEGEGFKIAMSALDNGRYTVGQRRDGLDPRLPRRQHQVCQRAQDVWASRLPSTS